MYEGTQESLHVVMVVPKYSARCRACLNSVDDMEYEDLEAPFFNPDVDDSVVAGVEYESLNLLQVFNDCTQLQVQLEQEDDDTEWDSCRYLCSICSAELRNAYQFVVKARISDCALRKRTVMFAQDKMTDIVGEDAECDDTKTVVEHTEQKNHNLDLDDELAVIFGDDEFEQGPDENNCKDQESENTVEDIMEENVEILETSNFVEGEEGEVEDEKREEEVIADPSSSNNDDDETTSIVVCFADSDVDADGDADADGDGDGDADAHEKSHNRHMLEFKCELCTMKFDFQRDLMQHYDQDHEEKHLHFACPSCDQRFFRKSTLNVHIRQIHQNCEYLDCFQCGRTVLKSFFKVHSQRHKKKHHFLCSACPSTFTSRYTLKKHQQIHLENRNRDIKCEECDRKFFTIESYRTHQVTHKDPKQRTIFNCSLCEKSFMRQSNLKLHIQMHRGETMDCPHCGKKFVRRKDLEIHIRFHTGEFPYFCSTCGQRFAIKGHLKSHEKKHDGIKFACTICGREFLNEAGLKQHSYKHTGMPLCCAMCQKGFPTKFKVRRHIRSVHYDVLEDGLKARDIDQLFIKRRDVDTIADTMELVNFEITPSEDRMDL